MENQKVNESSTISIASLEAALGEAQKEKTLAQIPALRRLRNVLRLFFVFGVISLIYVIEIGKAISLTFAALDAAGFGSVALKALYVLILWPSLTISLVMVVAYYRFLKQFKRNYVLDIEDTTVMLLRIYSYGVLASILLLPFSDAIIGQAAGALVGIGVFIFQAAIILGMYAVVRHYLVTAQAELPTLIAASERRPSGKTYLSWRVLFFIGAVLSLLFLAWGYYLGGGLP